jgi:hypothetical protein
MAAPVVNPNQSILAYGIGQDFTFRLIADQPVSEWMIDPAQPLPHGLVFHAPSGTLMGAGTVPGIWQLNVSAKNAAGEISQSVPFVLGVFETQEVEVVKKVMINAETWAVSLLDPEAASSTKPAVAGSVRYGDDVVFDLKFFISATNPDAPSVVSLPVVPRLRMARFSLRGNDTEASFFTTGPAAFRKTTQLIAGLYETKFRLYASLESAELAAWLGEFETESGTEADAFAEFELQFDRPSGAPGPAINKITTQKFLLRVRRDLVR